MKLIGIRTPKPRKYSYRPVYYDPVKEARENRHKDLGISDDGQMDNDLRLRMRLRMNRKKLDENIRKRSRMTGILFSLLLLLMVLYYIVFR